MLKLGWIVTAYIFLSSILFLATSNTINGGIIYIFLLFPFYVAILAGWWVVVLLNRTKKPRVKYWIWSIVLVLQIITMLVSPGNCFRAKEGARCYSNLQILVGQAPMAGPANVPHWVLVEDSFVGFLAAYGVALLLGLSSIERSLKLPTNRQ